MQQNNLGCRGGAGGVEFAGEVELPGADFVALGAVHASGHELQAGDYVVQLGAHSAGDNVVNGKLVAEAGAAPDGCGAWWIVSLNAAGAGEFEWTRWRAFFVAFDTNDVVIAARTRRLSSKKSLHEQPEAWAEKHHAPPNRIHPELSVARHP